MDNGFMYSYARFLNASPEQSAISFFVNDEELLKALPYGQISGYTRIPDGEVTFRAVITSGDDNIIYTLKTSVLTGEALTLALVGTRGSRTLIRINDTGFKNNYASADLRIANLVADSEGFDIYANGFPILDEIEYPQVSNYIFLRPDTYEFSVNAEKSDDTILNTGRQTLKSGMYYTLYLIGNVTTEGEPVSAVFAVDALSYNGRYL